MNGVGEGSDQVVTIYTRSTEGLTGCAKCDANGQNLFALPDDRVMVYEGRVEITLTDGGIGGC